MWRIQKARAEQRVYLAPSAKASSSAQHVRACMRKQSGLSTSAITSRKKAPFWSVEHVVRKAVLHAILTCICVAPAEESSVPPFSQWTRLKQLHTSLRGSRIVCSCSCLMHTERCHLSPRYAGETRWPGSDGCISAEDRAYLDALKPRREWWSKAWRKK
jgi:hypothetical protein